MNRQAVGGVPTRSAYATETLPDPDSIDLRTSLTPKREYVFGAIEDYRTRRLSRGIEMLSQASKFSLLDQVFDSAE